MGDLLLEELLKLISEYKVTNELIYEIDNVISEIEQENLNLENLNREYGVKYRENEIVLEGLFPYRRQLIDQNKENKIEINSKRLILKKINPKIDIDIELLYLFEEFFNDL